jgi:hypothetical protein
VLVLAGTAEAGSSAAERFGIEKFGEPAIRSLAEKVNQELDKRGANVAIIARSGRSRDALPKGIHYTHVAIAVFEAVIKPDGRIGHTYTVYNLYQGAEDRMDRSYLAQDFTFDMVAGTVEPDIGIIIPTPALQTRILSMIRSPAYEALHNPRYNLIANPFKTQFDNCVSHTLKVIVGAIYETDDIERIRKNIETYFEPQPVQVSLVQRMGSGFVQGVSLRDQGPEGPQCATFTTLRRFLQEFDLVEDSFSVHMDGKVTPFGD